jgi:hypothetical protein
MAGQLVLGVAVQVHAVLQALNLDQWHAVLRPELQLQIRSVLVLDPLPHKRVPVLLMKRVVVKRKLFN